MLKDGKIWGETSEIFKKNNVSIHRILIKKDHFCSKHKHDYKYNIFYIESGKIKIQHWQTDYDLMDETIISTGESCSIPPKHYHKFIALEDTIAYEIYYVELFDNDISRIDCGCQIK
jgi:quercetin dioxygenase-like cupin family protein